MNTQWHKFPVTRPLNRPVIVLIEGKLYLGNGCNIKGSGGGIKVNGKVFDSNHTILWNYI